MAVQRVSMAGPKLLSANHYDGRITSVEITQKEGSEFPCLLVHVALEEADERSMRRWFSYNPRALWSLIKLLEDLDVEHAVATETDEDGNDVETLEYDPELLEGKACLVEVGVGEYKGRKQNEVVAIRARV
jgi:hypothetical protein